VISVLLIEQNNAVHLFIQPAQHLFAGIIILKIPVF